MKLKPFLKPKDMAATLKQRLAERHAGDMFTTEALIGSGGAQRFDAWAMEPTWTMNRCVGYEVKVQRSDFVGDKKWTGYLPFCTEFFFVCPAGLIQPSELPPEVGLLWGTANAGKVYQKKPAIPGPIDPDALATMLKHVLMWRYRQRGDGGQAKAEAWLRDVEEGRDLDYRLKEAIKKAAGKLTAATALENKALKESQESAREVEHWLKVNGIDFRDNHWAVLREVEAAVKERRDGVTKEVQALEWDLRHTGERMTALADKIAGKEG